MTLGQSLVSACQSNPLKMATGTETQHAHLFSLMTACTGTRVCVNKASCSFSLHKTTTHPSVPFPSCNLVHCQITLRQTPLIFLPLIFHPSEIWSFQICSHRVCSVWNWHKNHFPVKDTCISLGDQKKGYSEQSLSLCHYKMCECIH